MIINEAMRQGDLGNLVLSVISIDEYNSKIKSDAIVVAFFVSAEEPAKELSYFIESGDYNIIDTEVSSIPNSDGNYAIFIEFIRSKTFFMDLKNILDDISNLTDNHIWFFTYYKGNNKEYKVNITNISKYINLTKNNKMNEQQDKVYNFFQNSILENVELHKNNKIRLSRFNKHLIIENIAMGDNALLSFLFGIWREPISLDSESLYECNQLKNMLGPNWVVNKIKEQYIINNVSNSNIMILTM